jgi:hypothetical protein
MTVQVVTESDCCDCLRTRSHCHANCSYNTLCPTLSRTKQVSRREADKFQLSRGQIIERKEKKLCQFETYRALWIDDERRKTVAEEWELLGGCC